MARGLALSGLAALVACAQQEAPTISGRYTVTSGTDCIGPTLVLSLSSGGTTLSMSSTFNGALESDGVDAYTLSSCDTVGCAGGGGGMVTFRYAHVERPSPTTVHGEIAVLSQRVICTDGVCPAGLNGTPCYFDATRDDASP